MKHTAANHHIMEENDRKVLSIIMQLPISPIIYFCNTYHQSENLHTQVKYLRFENASQINFIVKLSVIKYQLKIISTSRGSLWCVKRKFDMYL